jgi:hypothetical protein
LSQCARYWRRYLLTIAMMGIASAHLPAAGDEPVLRKGTARAIPLGPQMSGAELAQPKPLTIRRAVGTYLCPDPRDLTKRCPQIELTHNVILLGPGAPVAPRGSGLLTPPRVPDIDYQQPPAPGLYYVASALDRSRFHLPPLYPSPIILMQTRSASAPLPFQIQPSLHR